MMPARHGRVGLMVASLAVTVLMGALPLAGAASQRPGIFVEPFDLFDTSIDHRPFVIADQKRWLADASARIGHDLDKDGRVSVIATSSSAALLAAVAADYAHPSTCRSCALADARKLGSRYVFIGSVHKVSDLIIYMRGELDATAGGKPLMVKSMEVKADDKTMILRAADTMAAAVDRHLSKAN